MGRAAMGILARHLTRADNAIESTYLEIDNRMMRRTFVLVLALGVLLVAGCGIGRQNGQSESGMPPQTMAARISSVRETPMPGIAYAWGDNDSGQLGVGTITVKGSNHDARTPEPVDLPTGTLSSSMAGGHSHSLAATTSGQVYAWGYNAVGQLGDGNTTATTLPVLSSLPPAAFAVAVAAGWNQSLALTSTGTVYGWGMNEYGEVGAGTTKRNILVPTLVALPANTNVKEISAGRYHSLLATSLGHVFSFGLNSNGQLGDGTTISSDSPVRVKFPAGVVIIAVAGGDYHSLALASSGTVYAWGDNAAGQLGDGNTVQSDTPVLVQFPAGVDVVAIAAANQYSLALTSTGQIYAWGDNQYGTLGNGTTTSSDLPVLVQVPAGVTPTSITAGQSRCHLLSSEGAIYDWGTDENGQANQIQHLTPVQDAIPQNETPLSIFDGPDAEQYLTLMSQSGSTT